MAITIWLAAYVAPPAGVAIVAAGRVASRLIVTDFVLVPPALFAEQVYVLPFVSEIMDTLAQPLFDWIRDSGSVTVQSSRALVVYQPLLPNVPVTSAAMFGGVVSAAITDEATDNPAPALRIEMIANFLKSVSRAQTVDGREPAHAPHEGTVLT